MVASPTPPRRRFQFHLSTGVVLVLTAGAVLYVNTRVHKWVGPEDDYPERNHGIALRWFRVDSIGWPYDYILLADDVERLHDGEDISEFYRDHRPVSALEILRAHDHQFELTAFFDDIFVALLILWLAFGAWEGVLRLRAFLRSEPEEIESGG